MRNSLTVVWFMVALVVVGCAMVPPATAISDLNSIAGKWEGLNPEGCGRRWEVHRGCNAGKVAGGVSCRSGCEIRAALSEEGGDN